VTNPGLFGTGIPYGMSRRDLFAGGTPAADRTTGGTGMGVRGGGVGVGVGTGGAGGAPGDTPGDGACPFSFGFFPVVRFGAVLRGAGELCGWAIELPSLLKKSPMGLPAKAEGPPVRNALIAKIKTTRADR
jgi:hypothetical protein